MIQKTNKEQHHKGFYQEIESEEMSQYLTRYDFYFFHKNNELEMIAYGSGSCYEINDIVKNNFTWIINHKDYTLAQILELYPELENSTIEELIEFRTNMSEEAIQVWVMYHI